MTIGEAPEAIRKAVDESVREVNHKVMGREFSVSNALRNSAFEVLTNPSPSKPGNPPGVRSGNLRRNWTQGVRSTGGFGGGISAVAYIESSMIYADYLENGTHNKDGTQRMAARPYVDKILEDVEPEVDRIFADL